MYPKRSALFIPCRVLEAVIAILLPFSRGLDVFAGHGAGEIADDDDLPASAGRFHAEHAEPVLRVVKDDMIDDPG